MKRIDKSAIDRLPLEQRDEARAMLEELERQYNANPLLRYEPHPKQAALHASHTQLKAFLGGNRAGKTTAGVLDDIIQAVDRNAVPDRLLPYKKFDPPFYGRVIVPGEDLLNAVVHQKFREWCPKDQLVGGSFDKAYEKAHGILRFKNGSYIDFMTYGMSLDKLGGTAKHRIHYDEEPPFEFWQEGKMRLLDYKGADELFTMTPLQGLSWMYRWIWQPWIKKELTNAFIVVCSLDDNPYLDPVQKQLVLAGYTKEELEARRHGRFVHFHGMIYEEFDGNCIVPEDKIPPNVRIYVGIDPGIRHMAAVVWCYLTADDQLVVFDELHLQGGTVQDVCEGIKLTNFKHAQDPKQAVPIKPKTYYIDPSAANRVHQTGRSDQAEYMKHGIVVTLGQNAVPSGINAVRERIRGGKLKVMANCTELIEEFQTYRWQRPQRHEGDPTEKPLKQDDHLLDALRYVVMGRPIAPKGLSGRGKFVSPAERQMKEEMSGRKWRKQRLANANAWPGTIIE